MDADFTVYLVSCVQAKLPRPAPARELYNSVWFKKARQYVEMTECPWFILSARYGLLDPTRVVNPYELTLNTMAVGDRRKWASQVVTTFIEAVPTVRASTVTIHVPVANVLDEAANYLFGKYRDACRGAT